MNNKSRSALSGVSQLALSFALPHEHKPERLPVVPACHTSTLSLMSDGTFSVPDGSAGAFKQGFLCRDACKPLWLTYSAVNLRWALISQGSATTWNLPARANTSLSPPNFSRILSTSSSGTLDMRVITNRQLLDYGAIGRSPDGGLACYIPPGAFFEINLETAVAGGGTGIEFQIHSFSRGEVFTVACTAISIATGFAFSGTAGTNTVGSGTCSGTVPYGFVWLGEMRTTTTAPTVALNPTLFMGWRVAAVSTALMLPAFPPPEFYNSPVPYQRSRANATAALFTNVTAVMQKEGTILAGRLKASMVDPWIFTTNDINSVYPALRYFGPLEKGLYTFTTPSGNSQFLQDSVYTIYSDADPTVLAQPMFQFDDIGIYNAFIFSDVSASTGTTLAVSLYSHLEFETVSSLFTPGVSLRTLECLHAAEVALLKFGHFHENPIHWAALKAAATAAMRFVGPMVAPIVQHYGQQVLNAGVSYLGKKVGGDRQMNQALTPKPQKTPTHGKRVKVKKPKGKRK